MLKSLFKEFVVASQHRWSSFCSVHVAFLSLCSCILLLTSKVSSSFVKRFALMGQGCVSKDTVRSEGPTEIPFSTSASEREGPTIKREVADEDLEDVGSESSDIDGPITPADPPAPHYIEDWLRTSSSYVEDGAHDTDLGATLEYDDTVLPPQRSPLLRGGRGFAKSQKKCSFFESLKYTITGGKVTS